jgi:hypothetical protein
MAVQDTGRVAGPYELGLWNSPDAIGPLIGFLERGGANEKRLAASAIRKLTERYRGECQAAVPALVACLEEPAPQVRQYALKALGTLRPGPDVLDRLQVVQDRDDRPYNRALARSILQQHPQQPASTDRNLRERPGSSATDPLTEKVERCLEAIGHLESDLHDNLDRLWDAEIDLADAQAGLVHAEQRLIVRGVEGRNETERRAQLAASLPREHQAVDEAERLLRFARREREEFRGALELVQQRLKALELLVQLRMVGSGHE